MKTFQLNAANAKHTCISPKTSYTGAIVALYAAIAGRKTMRLVTKNASRIVVSTKMNQGDTGFLIGPSHGNTSDRDFRGCIVMACGNGKLTVLSSANRDQVGFLIQKSYLVMPQEYHIVEGQPEESANPE